MATDRMQHSCYYIYKYVILLKPYKVLTWKVFFSNTEKEFYGYLSLIHFSICFDFSLTINLNDTGCIWWALRPTGCKQQIRFNDLMIYHDRIWCHSWDILINVFYLHLSHLMKNPLFCLFSYELCVTCAIRMRFIEKPRYKVHFIILRSPTK